MNNIALVRNPLRPNELALYSHEGPLIDWLQSYAPSGFGAPIRIYLNGQELPIAQADTEITEADSVGILVLPHAPVAAFFAISIAGTTIGTMLVNAIVGLAISFIVNKLFAPKLSTNQSGGVTNTIYDLNARQNVARIGEPIPCVYGRDVLTVPDLAAQPWTCYEEFVNSNNTNPPRMDRSKINDGEQYLFYLMCIGHGKHLVRTPDIRLGDAKISDLPETDVRLTHHLVAEHNNQLGNIEGIFNAAYAEGPRFHENVYTSVSVSGQEFKDTNDGLDINGDPIYYPVGDEHVDKIGIDIVFPRGMFLMNSDGSFGSYEVDVNVHIRNKDTQAVTVKEYAFRNTGVKNVTPWRVTINIPVTAGRYEVGLERKKVAPSNPQRIQGAYTWAGLRGFIKHDTTASVYSDAHMLAMRIKASEFTSNEAQGRIQVPVSRYLTTANKQYTITNNPADCVYDAYSNPVYGAGRPDSEIDLNLLVKLRNHWTPLAFKTAAPAPLATVPTRTIQIDRMWSYPGGSTSDYDAWVIETVGVHELKAGDVFFVQGVVGLTSINGRYFAVADPYYFDRFIFLDYQKSIGGAYTGGGEILIGENAGGGEHEDILWHTYGFNAVFTQRTVLYDAMASILAVVAAEPMPIGSELSFAYDGIKPRTQVYSDANIVRDSLSLNWSFHKNGEPDGVLIEYNDQQTWDIKSVQHPVDALDPQRISMLGITVAGHAEQLAIWLWNRKLLQRKSVQFTTELEGLLPVPGDRIGVQTSLIEYTGAGAVVSWSAGQRLMTLDTPQDFSGPGPYFILLRDKDGTGGDPIEIDPKNATTVLLLADPSFTVQTLNSDSPTLYMVGPADKVINDYIVQRVTHQGGVTVSIQAVEYDEAIYDRALPFMKELV